MGVEEPGVVLEVVVEKTTPNRVEQENAQVLLSMSLGLLTRQDSAHGLDAYE